MLLPKPYSRWVAFTLYISLILLVMQDCLPPPSTWLFIVVLIIIIPLCLQARLVGLERDVEVSTTTLFTLYIESFKALNFIVVEIYIHWVLATISQDPQQRNNQPNSAIGRQCQPQQADYDGSCVFKLGNVRMLKEKARQGIGVCLSIPPFYLKGWINCHWFVYRMCMLAVRCIQETRKSFGLCIV